MISSMDIFAPPLYPVELIEKYFIKNKAEQIMRIKIADYQSRHGGRNPARIFVSFGMFIEIGEYINYGDNGIKKFMGIPLSVIYDEDRSIVYFSDEEDFN